jgi:hypothetical protein
MIDQIEVWQDLNKESSPYYGPHWKRITLNLHADGSVTWEPSPERGDALPWKNRH